MDAKKRYELRKRLKELRGYRGRHTELVSVYIPAGYELSKIVAHLSQEQGTAVNIKSATTRKNVISALEKMIQHLKLYNRTPENGLAVFSGNISEREGQTDMQVWSIEPPTPLKIRVYRCDKGFVLEPLEEMLEIKDFYALLVMDRREADLALLKGKSIIPVFTLTSAVPGKFKTGGQSAKRFAMNRELAAKEFYHRIAEHVKEQLFGKEYMKGIIVGGPGPTKYDFVDGNFLITELKNKVLGIKDLAYTGDFGLQELLERSDDILASEEVAEEKKIMTGFFELLATKPKSVTYGKVQVEKAINMGAADTLLLSESVDDKTSEQLIKESEAKGTKVFIVSIETREGFQLKQMGGIAAILRYELNM